MALATLIGLDRQGTLDLQKVKEAEAERSNLKRILKEGLVDLPIKTLGQLRKRHRDLRRTLDRLERELSGFKIVDSYDDVVRQADDEQREIDRLNNENLIDQELTSDLEGALQMEAAPASPDLRRLYEEAGVVLPDVSLRRYDEVERFHQTILRNRKAHLSAEIADARQRMTKRSEIIRRLSNHRNELLTVIDSGGALSQYRKMDTERSRLQAEFEAVEQQISVAEKIESLQSDLKVRRAQAERAIQQDISERRSIVDEAAGIFEEISGKLYDVAGTLNVSASKNGLDVEVEHPDIGSTGIKRAHIFVFDLTLAIVCAARGWWPGFLVHDSHIFDGVDSRQIGFALREGGERTRAIGGQYIVTMNSDVLEQAEHDSGLSFAADVVNPVLDDSPTGGLFGFRFASPAADRDDSSADG